MFGPNRQSFFVPFSSVWTPPKPTDTLAVNTDLHDFEMQPSSPSPVPPRLILSVVDQETLTSPPLTCDRSAYTDSAADLEFAALLRDTDDSDKLRQELLAERARFARLESQFRIYRSTMEQTLMNLAAKTKEAELLDRTIKDLKERLVDIQSDVDFLRTDRGALAMLHELLSSLCAPADIYIDKVVPGSMFYKVLGCSRTSSTGDLKKSYHRLMRLCHPDKHPQIARHISQRVNEIYAVLSDERSRRIYDCCGISAVHRRDSSHFCRLCNPRLDEYESLDDLWK